MNTVISFILLFQYILIFVIIIHGVYHVYVAATVKASKLFSFILVAILI